MRLRFATFCSGIETVSLAWEPLGMVPVFFSEIEPFPCAVLAHRWPRVRNLGDLRRIDGRRWKRRVTIAWGSTPCQAFSFAGRRRGLADARGNLTLAFVQRCEEIDPPYICWENVKGVLSDKSNAFGCLLGALAGEDGPLVAPGGKWAHAGYVLGPKRTVAWRLFDAQHGGVPQRRERVFLVASSRDGADPREILFEREGLRRDSAPRRDAEPTVAALTSCGVGTCGADDNQAQAGRLIAVVDAPCPLQEVGARTGASTHKRQHGIGIADAGAAMYTLQAGTQHGVAYALRADAVRSGVAKTPSVDAAGKARLRNPGFNFLQDLAPTLDTAEPHFVAYSGEVVAFGASMRGRDGGASIELAPAELSAALRTATGGGSKALVLLAQIGEWIGARVRRLTPVECERLQGLPDNHTRIPFRGRTADLCPDGPRYKAIGNGLALKDVQWIGRRIQRAHGMRRMAA